MYTETSNPRTTAGSIHLFHLVQLLQSLGVISASQYVRNDKEEHHHDTGNHNEKEIVRLQLPTEIFVLVNNLLGHFVDRIQEARVSYVLLMKGQTLLNAAHPTVELSHFSMVKMHGF